MGKINKYSNIYDINGELIRKAPLTNYTVEELEELCDKIAERKDDNGNIIAPQQYNNAMSMLFKMYQKYGNPHKEDLIKQLKEHAKLKTTGEDVKRALGEVESVVDMEQHTGVEESIEPKENIVEVA